MPLDLVFTYAVPDGMQPVVGGRVLVPFRQQRMSGIVTAVHDRKPEVKTKNVISVDAVKTVRVNTSGNAARRAVSRLSFRSKTITYQRPWLVSIGIA